MDWDELLPKEERTEQAKQQPLEGDRHPSSENPLLQGTTVQDATIGQAVSSVPGFTLPAGWIFPTPDTSGAPLNRVINAAYQQIHGVYEMIKAREAEGELSAERAAELKARFNAVLKSEKVANAEEAITREFRSFQAAVKSSPVDHKGKMAAAGNVRAGCAWLVKYVRWFVWNEEAGGEGKAATPLHGNKREAAGHV